MVRLNPRSSMRICRGAVIFPFLRLRVPGYAAKFDSARDIADRNCSESDQFRDYEGGCEECVIQCCAHLEKNLPTQAAREEPVTSHVSFLFRHFRALASWLLQCTRRKRPVASPGLLR